jgi:hypothetical protein
MSTRLRDWPQDIRNFLEFAVCMEFRDSSVYGYLQGTHIWKASLVRVYESIALNPTGETRARWP